MAATRTPFEIELDGLREMLLLMAARADAMLERSIRAVVDQDVGLAREVIRADDEVDRLDIQIETECMRMIACQQPVASDLRLIGTALKAITDVERLGDYAVDIAKIGRRLARRCVYRPLIDLPHLGGLVRQMLRDALAAFVDRDLAMVQTVIAADSQVDDLYHAQRDGLIDMMANDPGVVYTATYLLLAAKYLERAADHVVNIAERVHYMETGELPDQPDAAQGA